MNWKLLTKIYIILNQLEDKNVLDMSEIEMSVMAQCLYEKLQIPLVYRKIGFIDVSDAFVYAMSSTWKEWTPLSRETVEEILIDFIEE